MAIVDTVDLRPPRHSAWATRPREGDWHEAVDSLAGDPCFWWLDSALAGPRTSGRFSYAGADPWLVGPLVRLPDDTDLTFEAELAIRNPDFPIDAGAAQVFWMGSGDIQFSEERSLLMPLVNDGQLRRVAVDLTAHPAWPRSGCVWLRFDPANGPCELTLARLSIQASGERDRAPEGH